ncbi:MAG: prolipoprotein diacylglyceryl transferase family protein, partial [Candidatus Shapirobacteria bacterium]
MQPFHLYGLIIGISFVIGISYFSRHNHTIPKSKENLFIFLLFLFSIIGARLYHVIDQYQYYFQHPAQILQTWNGGLGIYGGLIFALIFIFLFSKIYHLNFLKILDTITPIIPLCQAIGR